MYKNPASYIILFTLIFCTHSCTDELVSDSEFSEPIVLDSEISLEGLSNGMIIDEIIKFSPVIGIEPSEVATVEIKFNESTLLLTDLSTQIDYEFDPEMYDVGEATFYFIVTDKNGEVYSLEVPVNIHRRLITINIPENTMNSAIVFPVVFISRMDGSLLTWKEILREDRQITLSSPEEFDSSTEFMLSFYLQDNGNMTGISTYQNLTRNNPKTLNFSKPVRGVDTPSLGANVPIANFLSADFLIGNNGGILELPNSLNDVTAGYNVFLDTSEQYLGIGRYVTPENPEPFDSLYLYNGRSYEYLFLDFPLAEDYILDKANFTIENLESRELLVRSENISSNTTAHLSIYGATSQAEASRKRYHQIYHFNRFAGLNTQMQYLLNNSFYSYLHAFHFGSYFTERKGPPLQYYQIPNVTLDHTFANNRINLSIVGTDHTVGRVHCVDFDNLTYDWTITFKSEDAEEIIIPELPESISHPSKDAHDRGNIKVEEVELISYQSIPSYEDYIENVFKDQRNILDVTDWYQFIFSSRTGNFNRPTDEVIFQ